MTEIFISVDIEADGPIPGVHSMLSFGCVALDIDGNERGTFSANLEQLEGSIPDPATMKWWSTQQEAWEACRKDLEHPSVAMHRFCAWVEAFKDKGHSVVMVCAPAGFDFTYMYWYMMNFAGYSPVGFNCLDMRTFAFASLKGEYWRSGKSSWPRRWFPVGLPHTHVALDDAREQGHTFVRMLRDNRKMD